MTAYLDLNIFDKIEKINTMIEPEKIYYQTLFELLSQKKLTTAYSNAHLNDLLRGYKKNPNFIDGHLSNINFFTKNLCICQYWGEKTVKWHFREIFEFFHKKYKEWEFQPNSFSDLYETNSLRLQMKEIHELISLPIEFKKAYIDPMHGIMFPLAKIKNNFLALQEDIFNFQSRLKSDYGLYRTFRAYLISSIQKVKNTKEFLKFINANFKDLPKHLELIDIYDVFTSDTKTSDNALYSKVIEVFFKFDLAGYKSDGHFNNMFDDGLHTFYAAHFDYFITNDDRCKYKAEMTYRKLKIKTKVITIEQIETILNDTKICTIV
jgi:hypothetical protein